MSSPPPIVAYAVRDQRAIDLQHLKVLAICHWVWGALVGLFSCFGLLYIAMGWMALSGNLQMNPPTTNPAVIQSNQMAQSVFGWMFIGMGSAFLVIGWTLALLSIYSGFQLRRARRRVFSIVIAAINCAFFPFGTALGVFTLLVILRESTRVLYEENRATQSIGASSST